MKLETKRFLWGSAALLALIWAVWAQVGGFDYIFLDDNLYTYEYAPVAGGLSWSGFVAVCRRLTQGGIWMPLTSLTYMFDISAFGAGPGPHHVMSVVWHSFNALLVFYLVYELTDRRSLFAAFVGAALWAVHAQRCESVTWIASRKDTVFAFYALLGLIAWRRGHAFLAYLLMFASCCSKPTAMVFPVLAFCVEKESPLFLSKLKDAPVQTLKAYFLRYSPMLVLTVATAILTVYSQTHWDNDVGRGLTEGYGSFPWRCLNALVSLGLYFAQFVVPYNVHIIYRAHTDAVPAGMVPGLVVLLLVVAGLVWAFCRRRHWSLLWLMALWFLAAIGPTLGVAGGFGDHARADRFLYLPMIGVSVLIAWGLSNMKLSCWTRGAAIAAVIVSAVVTFANASSYRDDYTIFHRVASIDNANGRALHHVATELMRRFNRIDDAIEVFRHMYEVDRSDEGGAKLMTALATRGRVEDFPEIKFLGQKLEANPELDNEGMGVEALGMVALREGRPTDGIRYFKAAISAPKRKFPSDDAKIQLAMCYYNLGRYVEARQLFETLVDSKSPKVKTRSLQSLQVLRQRHPECFTENENKETQK